MAIVYTRVRRKKKRKLRGFERRVVVTGQVSAKVMERLRKAGVMIVQGPT